MHGGVLLSVLVEWDLHFLQHFVYTTRMSYSPRRVPAHFLPVYGRLEQRLLRRQLKKKTSLLYGGISCHDKTGSRQETRGVHFRPPLHSGRTGAQPTGERFF
jgi:hypothetical protein